MAQDPLDRLLAPEPQGDPLDVLLRRQAQERAAASLATVQSDPETAARANRLARDLGLPASTVERKLKVIERQVSIRQAVQAMRSSSYLTNWYADPRNAAATRDDAVALRRLAERVEDVRSDEDDRLTAAVRATADRHVASSAQADGFFSRGMALLRSGASSVTSGLDRTGAALAQWSADNPLPWTSAEQIAHDRRTAEQLRRRAGAEAAAAAAPIRGQTTFADVKKRPTLGNVLSYSAQAGLQSLPGMAAAAISTPAYVISQAGNIGQNRAQNNSRQDAQIGDVLAATPAAVVSALLERMGAQGIFTSAGKNAGTRILSATGKEAATEALQSDIEYAGATVGTDKGFDSGEALEQMAAGGLAGGFVGGGLRGLHESGGGVRKSIRALRDRASAAGEGETMDAIMDAAEGTRTKQRDPDMLRQFLEGVTEDSAVENIYVPGEAVVAYLQSTSEYDRDFWEPLEDQIAEAVATGADVVLPTAEVAARLAGTPAWDALREDARFSPGGASRREAGEMPDDVAGEFEAAIDDAMNSAREAAAPQDKLFQSMSDKLATAGFTPDAARQYAALYSARAAARASRLGSELTGEEYNDLEVRQVLPETLAPIVGADGLDIVIRAMRRGRDATTKRAGPSLVEWIAKRGGIEDRDGDVAAMGGDRWHREGKFRKKLIKPADADGQGAMFAPGEGSATAPDSVLAAAIEAGFFPDIRARLAGADANYADLPDLDVLYDAISAELRGSPVFAEEAEADSTRLAAQELAQLLEDAGLDPAAASDADIRTYVDRYRQQQIEGRSYGQPGDGETRGRAIFDGERRIIELFEKRDLSTFLHESGHVFLEELQADALTAVDGDGNSASRQLFADWETVKAWFATNGHAIGEDGRIPVDAHEMWARGFERFLLEGKAPSSALRRAFDAFRSWLLTIYQVVQNLRAPITDEIRDVMGRMIATDEEIAAAREEQEIRLSFDREQLGMTEAEYAALQQASIEARDEARDALLYRVMATVRARRTKEYQAQRDAVLEDIAADVMARPVFRAMTTLRGGAKIDKGWLIATYGEDVLGMMPKAVPPIYAENGQSPDAIAELAGFDGGDAMVRELMGVEERRKQMRAAGDNRSVLASVIADETDAIMRDRYGDPLADGSIEREAREIVHSDRNGEVIAAELRALERRRRGAGDPNQGTTAYQVAKRWAADKIRSGKVADVASRAAIEQYQRAVRRASRLAEEAMMRGDIDEAFLQKRSQMLNNALVTEAGRAAEAIDEAVARMSKIAKRRTMKNVDQDYLEQAQALLEAVELRERSQVSIRKQGAFEAWARKQEAEGRDVVVPASFEAALGTTHWSRLSVERLLGLDDAIGQIMQLGRLKQTMLDAREEREFEAVVRDAVDAAEKLPQRPPTDLMEPSWADRFKAGVANADAALLKMETVFDWLDGGNSNGVFNRIAFRPLAEAQDRENAMATDYLGQIAGAFSALPRDVVKHWQDRIQLPELQNRDTGNPWVLTRQQLVALALNTGNEGNMQRLTDGYGWPPHLVRDVLNRELRAEEWRFVQQVWDIIDTLWPEIAAVERRVNGVEPDKVMATPVETPHGTFRGGYYPAVYDSAKSYRAEQFTGEASDLLDGRYTRATTRASSSKERSEKVKRPILLNLGVINRHLGEVIHDITHREALINAWRFLGEERVMRAIDQSLGPAIRQQFKPWLRHVANSWATERAGNEGIGAFVNGMRTNATIVGMGMRVSTIMMQLAGYSNSFEYVGARWVLPAIAQMARRPVETFRFAMARSGEIANRMDTLDRDIRRSVNALRGKRGAIADAKRLMFHGIGYMDRVVSIPTWLGGYNKAIAGGAEEIDAVYAADKAVRSSQGASGAKDLAAVARGDGKWGEALKFFTMFYSYLSAFHQRQRSLGRDIASAVRGRDYRATPRLVARAWWLIVVPPVLAELLAGRGPAEDEDWGWWSFRKMLFQMLGPIPLVRDIGEPVWAKATGQPSFGYSISPLQRVGETFVNLAGDVGKASRGEETKRATRNTLEAAGYATGLVPGQAAAAAQFLVDVGYGEQDPDGVAEWWEGLTTGKIKDED
ncbi:acetyltransferase [Sphingomonas koreensis]|uniref:Acetyltransferase n=1 Tax=Sphingomonas koreensis TaxID=93064 RepID=A0A430G2B3_9SPHN|nr:acetyltransferase [Sphingomonas koreensis]RSY83109.1 acetyltransferase [Sphingomonas koreensis]